jgi:biopolymer transport protein ExbD
MSIAMPRGARADLEPMMEMNMTPLIDVMLVLIIMMILTIPKANHSIDLNMPKKSSSSQLPTVFNVDITADGSILWDGALVTSREALRKNMEMVAGIGDKASLQVHANRSVAYRTVAGVMALAQRAHVKNLGMVGNQ